MRALFSIFAFLAFLSIQSYAANLAIIDSGVDYKHKDLAPLMWTNPNPQTQTKDGLYKDDTHGWNFAENNNKIIDYKYLGTFPEDCFKVFEVQGKVLKGTASDEEKTWYKSKKADKKFLSQLQTFGNFIHGTHVSGIASHESPKSELMALKLIPTKSPLGRVATWTREAEIRYGRATGVKDIIAKFLLKKLASQEVKLLTTISDYVAVNKGQVANGSFGTSVSAVSTILGPILKVVLGHELSEAELKSYGIYFIDQIVKDSTPFMAASPDTLFVFAAGNDGTNNDTLPTWPANAKGDNTISVAATSGVSSLASFSNYGEKLVEVAAPGVVIRSTIPGDRYLSLSGTSMAAPFVTNVAGLVKDANASLRPVEIKRILMETVDVKDFLKGKVTSSGIVNRARAVKAAELSTTVSLDEAISQARTAVPDVTESRDELAAVNAADLLVLPLPNPIL